MSKVKKLLCPYTIASTSDELYDGTKQAVLEFCHQINIYKNYSEAYVNIITNNIFFGLIKHDILKLYVDAYGEHKNIIKCAITSAFQAFQQAAKLYQKVQVIQAAKLRQEVQVIQATLDSKQADQTAQQAIQTAQEYVYQVVEQACDADQVVEQNVQQAREAVTKAVEQATRATDKVTEQAILAGRGQLISKYLKEHDVVEHAVTIVGNDTLIWLATELGIGHTSLKTILRGTGYKLTLYATYKIIQAIHYPEELVGGRRKIKKSSKRTSKKKYTISKSKRRSKTKTIKN